MNVAFIPVRDGGRSVPLKNIKPDYNKTLIYRIVEAACECRYMDIVYVSTDSSFIRDIILSFKTEDCMFDKVQVIAISAESASTESAMLEFASEYEFDNIVLIQATSPIITGKDLNGGFELYNLPDTDSVFSAVRQKRPLWAEDEDGIAAPLVCDVNDRPCCQNFEGYLMENGNFYITSKTALIESQSRISGRIRAYVMPLKSAHEPDDSEDRIIAEDLMKTRQSNNEEPGQADLKPEIKMFLTDCDGCLTDGGMYYSEYGDELKKFNTRDGMGLSLLKKKGILTGIITSENVDLNRRRAEKLKVDILEEGCKDKGLTIGRLCDKYQISMENIAYVGDDLNDLDAIRMVGLGCCPADAATEVKDAADFITNARGGEGVIREVSDMILRTYNGH